MRNFSLILISLILTVSAFAGMVDHTPKLGEIVHYTSLQAVDEVGAPADQAAIVTRVREDGQVALHIFYPSGTFVKDNVPYSETSQPGHWHSPQKD